MKTTVVIKRLHLRQHSGLAWGIVILLAAGAARAQNSDPRKGRVTANPTQRISYTFEQEMKLGQQAAAEIETKLTLVPSDDPASQYINDLGQKLASVAPGYKFPYTFKIVREKSVNAFALPGGPIYVHTGLIENANEGELAGVIGHEIAHVVMRHSARQVSRQTGTQIPLAILGGVLGSAIGGWGGDLAQMGISFTAGSVLMKYSRDAEREADMVGAQIMYDAGFDPQSMVSFFRKLEQEGSKGGPEFLNSHPNPGNRAQNVQAMLSRYPPKKYPTADSAAFLDAKTRLANLPPPPPGGGPSTGPSGAPRLSVQTIAGRSYRTFRHNQYSISYPTNWRVNGNSRAMSVTFYPDGGLSSSSLTYGVIVSGFTPFPRNASRDEAMRQLMVTIQQANSDLRPTGQRSRITLAGRQAEQRDFLLPSAVVDRGRQLRERVRLVALPYRNGEYLYLLIVAPVEDFAGLQATFNRMMNSLQLR